MNKPDTVIAFMLQQHCRLPLTGLQSWTRTAEILPAQCLHYTCKICTLICPPPCHVMKAEGKMQAIVLCLVGNGEVVKAGIKLKFILRGICSVLNWKMFPSVVFKFHNSALFVMTHIINENLGYSGRTPSKEEDGSRTSGVPTGFASLWQQFS